MSDVFISYAREDRALAEGLAADLRSRGYRIWWDAELVASDDFYDIILEALNKAQAAIVIWTKVSVRSRFVRDEARFALHLEKLVAVKEPSLSTLEIPFGFQSQHTDDVGNRDQIVKALGKLGVKAAAAERVEAAALAIDRLRTAGIEEIVAFLGSNPGETAHKVAVARLKEIAAGPPTTTQRSSDAVQSLKSTNWQAFLAGLTFRVPSFQLSTQGTWTSVGLAFAYLVLFAAGAFGSLLAASKLGDNRQTELVTAIVWSILSLIAWTRIGTFVAQRNLPGSVIVCLAFILVATLTGGMLQTVITGDGRSVPLLGFAAGGIVALALAAWRIRSAR